MKFKLLTIALISSLNAHGGIVRTDLHVAGDSLVALHEESGIEWLNLQATSGMTFTEVQGELGDGGLFEGWRIASRSEVNYLFEFLYPSLNLDTKDDYRKDWHSNYTGGNSTPYTFVTDPVYNTFGWAGTVNRGNESQWLSFGMYSADEGHDFKSDILMSGAYFKRVNEGNRNNSYYASVFDDFSSDFYTDPDFVRDYYGTFLVSDGGLTLSSIENPEINRNNINSPWAYAQQQATSVSEPFTAALFGLSVMGLALQRSSRKNH